MPVLMRRKENRLMWSKFISVQVKIAQKNHAANRRKKEFRRALLPRGAQLEISIQQPAQ